MTKQKLIDAEEEKRRLEEESAQVRGASPLPHLYVLQMLESWDFTAGFLLALENSVDNWLESLSKGLCYLLGKAA